MKRRFIALLLAALCLPMLPALAAPSRVSLRGVQLRHLAHRPTDRWYMAAPIDLTGAQEQVIDLIAANSRVAGSVSARVTEEGLVVSASYPPGARVLSQALRLIEDLTLWRPDGQAGQAITPGQAAPLSEAAKAAGQAWLYLEAMVELPGGDALPLYTAQGRQEIAQRIRWAQRHGLGESYLERLGSDTLPAGTGVPDENGCVDGVCPLPSFRPPVDSPGFTLRP